MANQRFGRRWQRVVVQRRTDTTDAYGEPIPAWATHATRRAQIIPLEASEQHRDGMPYTAQQFRFEFRYDKVLDGVNAKDRLQWNGRTFDIVSPPVNWQLRNTEIHIIGREVADGS